MIPLLAAFQFLTIFPTVIKRTFTPQEMGRAVGWFPLVGVALGLALYGVNAVARWAFPSSVAAALTLFAWILLTRALHLDGFMDACDGLFGGWTPERRLEIMKDPHMGAFGIIGGILVLLTEYSALSLTSNLLPSIMLATTLGRWASPLAIYFFPYAREGGLGTNMKHNTTIREIIMATWIAGVTSWFICGWLGLALMGAAALTAFLLGRYVMKRLPGLTGDIYGAITTIIEMGVLIFFSYL